MRHVIAARVLQDAPPGRKKGGNRGAPRSDSAWGWEVEVGGEELEGLDLLAGMDSNDTDYRKVWHGKRNEILRGYDGGRHGGACTGYHMIPLVYQVGIVSPTPM